MTISVYERRKFVRVDVHLDGRLNLRYRAAIKRLSLGGCLVEAPLPFNVTDSVQLEFSAFGEHVTLAGRVIHAVGGNRFGIRFEPGMDHQLRPLARMVEQFQQTENQRRPTRLRIRREAILDRDPVLLKNLSEGGCFLQTNAPLHEGDIVEIRFVLEEEEIHLAAQIRWKTPTGIGVEYLSPDPSLIDCISVFITKQATIL